MALTTFCFPISLILCSFMVDFASASVDYGYGSKPQLFHTPMFHVKEKPLPIGGVARITCLAVDENGYQTAPFSILSKPADSKGYYFATLYPNELNHNKLKLAECKAFLEKSPLETCKVATDVNKGITGAPLSYRRLLDNKKMTLYSVPPFIFSNGY
ncbi:hypothetical protein Golob_020146 [Gossypium lobatum]|uniref:Pollen Ole e 1 allergen and extensin family protein n=1 Tax=Gossypium lobatum TaxID=34289 RepID=A0A7J8L9H0_9ROSI|nr:hypothetical protein [Gossypium lobatum]